jgi:hypothetical protein
MSPDLLVTTAVKALRGNPEISPRDGSSPAAANAMLAPTGSLMAVSGSALRLGSEVAATSVCSPEGLLSSDVTPTVVTPKIIDMITMRRDG